MPVRKAEAEWKGSVREGAGHMKLGTGGLEGPYSFPSRFEEGNGTNPEELLGAAHAGCFSMQFAGELGRAGFNPNTIHTVAKVHIERDGAAFSVTKIELHTEAAVSGIEEEKFQEIAESAKKNCPISRALAAITDITLDAKLNS